MVLKTISSGCGVQASPMLFYIIVLFQLTAILQLINFTACHLAVELSCFKTLLHPRTRPQRFSCGQPTGHISFGISLNFASGLLW